jgi:hypothetical protein
MACGGIYQSPPAAVAGILEWGIDLWPYVNGKALVSGLHLPSMEASDMVDVIHYYFEEDFRFKSAEESEYRDLFRENIYSNLYKTEYKHSINKDRKTQSDELVEDDFSQLEPSELDSIKPFNPRAKEIAPYVPPTEFNPNGELPFGSILDAPIN